MWMVTYWCARTSPSWCRAMGALPPLKPAYGPASRRLYEFALALDEDSAKSTVGQSDASTQEDEPIFVGNDGVGVELGPPWRGWRTPEDE